MKFSAPLSWHKRLIQRPLILSVALFAFALLLRLVALGRYITPDELIWVYRSVLFREALRSASWADTLVAGHPGVITTWLGTLGISVQLLLNPADQAVYRWVTQLAWLTPDNMVAFQQLSAFLSAGRMVVAIITSLGIVVVYWLARRLLGDGLALLVALLLAVDPFFAGLSGLLHVDGLVATFVTISLLTLALVVSNVQEGKKRPSRLSYAALSGGSAALAVLAKSPALLLVPLSALVLLLSLWTKRDEPVLARLRSILPIGAVWIGSFLLVTFLVFPALWVSPGEVLQTASSNANRHVAEALRPTFFLGRVAYDHGPLFYPVSLAWRLGPLVFVGLIILVGLLVQRGKWRQLPLFPIFILVLWIAFFLAGITLAAKKFDRYALPVIPALTILAAIGWLTWLKPAKRSRQVFLAALLVVQFLYLLSVLPYPLAAYNPLLGGQYSAKYVLPLGWGESISSAGQWLAGTSGVEQKSSVSGIAPSLAPFFPGETVLAEKGGYERADYLIFTANSRQVDLQGVDQATSDLELMHTIRYGAQDQSWIYRNPTPKLLDVSPVDLPEPINFGEQMQLMGQEIRVVEGDVQFTARWDRQAPDGRFLVKLRLADKNGLVWEHLETALLNEVYFYPEHWQQGETPVVTYVLGLPPAIPPGNYNLELTLVEEDSNAQIPVLSGDGSFQGVRYEAGEVALAVPETPLDPMKLDMVAMDGANWADGSLSLLGHSRIPELAVSGADLTVDLFWQANAHLPDGLQVAVRLADEDPVVLSLSGYDSGLWRAGMIVQEKYRLAIPPEMDAGEYTLAVRPLYADGQPIEGPPVMLGQVEVTAFDRLFTLPEEVKMPLNARFEPGIVLYGANVDEVKVAPGEAVGLTLFWQTEGQTEEPVTAFVHIVDSQGNIVAQADRWPGGLPSDIWAEGQVIVDDYELEIPPDTGPGSYQIAVGLYTAGNGQRLLVSDAGGQPYPDDKVIIPVTVTIAR